MKRIRKQMVLACCLGTLLTACGAAGTEAGGGLISMETAKQQSHIVTEDVAPVPTETPTPGPEADVPGSDTPAEPTAAPGVSDTKDGEFEETNDTVYVAVSRLNLRTGPSTENEVVGRAVYGDTFVRLAKGNNGWDKLLYEGQVVYAYAEYLTTEVVTGKGDDSMTIKMMTSDVKKNLRL